LVSVVDVSGGVVSDAGGGGGWTTTVWAEAIIAIPMRPGSGKNFAHDRHPGPGCSEGLVDCFMC
jgi:hypothetical protein